MGELRESMHGQWSGRWAFILAATGSAVGLGNIWKFPYITGENGGGAFVLVYLLCIALIGIPVMMAEVLLGRRGRRSPINTMRFLVKEGGCSHAWRYIGWAGVVAGFLILSYYSVIAGWALAYLFRTANGLFVGANAELTAGYFSALVADPERLLAWHTIFTVMTMMVVARGVRGGLEVAVRLLMPSLLVLLLILVGYALNTGFFQQALAFLFTPDFHALFYKMDEAGIEVLSLDGVLTAMGHAFFTLSLGMGAIMVYGSYLPRHTSITKTVFVIASADTLVALLAGMAIFPIVFAYALEPGSGPGLIFQTLPLAFGQMPYGTLFGTLFFMLLVFAAWTSAISLVEPVVAWLVENHNMNRVKASVITGLLSWTLGIGTIFSFNIWSGEQYQLFGKSFFELLDYLTANIMLPLGGVLMALFVGWSMRREAVAEELALDEGILFRGWYLLIRYVTPVAMMVVFLNIIGIFDLIG